MTISVIVNSFLTFLQFSQKCALPVILSFMKFGVAQTFLVKPHLNDVLEFLLVIGLKKNLSKLVIEYHRKIH